MKHFVIIILGLFLTLPVWGQSNSAQAQQDSTLIRIQDFLKEQNRVGRFKVYSTNNVYTSLRLDTTTGEVWALQIGINKDSDRLSYKICDAVKYDDPDLRTVGRYELYPTNNHYNFILLDTIHGFAYQVQWSTKEDECGRWMIW